MRGFVYGISMTTYRHKMLSSYDAIYLSPSDAADSTDTPRAPDTSWLVNVLVWPRIHAREDKHLG